MRRGRNKERLSGDAERNAFVEVYRGELHTNPDALEDKVDVRVDTKMTTSAEI